MKNGFPCMPNKRRKRRFSDNNSWKEKSYRQLDVYIKKEGELADNSEQFKNKRKKIDVDLCEFLINLANNNNKQIIFIFHN